MDQEATFEPFSVLMAFYSGDDGGKLNDAIVSVFSNSVAPKELVLVQDGPVGSHLMGVVSKLSLRHPINLIEISENRGLAAALNEGLKHVKTDLVLRADADDVNLSHRFERQLCILCDGYDLCGSWIDEFHDGIFKGRREVPLEHNEILNGIKKKNPFNHMTVGFRLSRFCDLIEPFYPEILYKEDYACWAQLLSFGIRACNVPEVWVVASAGDDNFISRRGGWKYLVSEYKLQRYMLNKGVQTVLGALIFGGLRMFLFSLPGVFRKVLYAYVLRKNVANTSLPQRGNVQ